MVFFSSGFSWLLTLMLFYLVWFSGFWVCCFVLVICSGDLLIYDFGNSLFEVCCSWLLICG